MSAPSTSLKGGGMPLRSALKNDDEKSPPPSGSIKAVQITEPPETPLSLSSHSEEAHHIKQFSAGIGNVRMSGRPPLLPTNSSRSSIGSSVPSMEGMGGYVSGASLSATEIPEEEAVNHESHRPPQASGSHHSRRNHGAERLLAQVAEWLHHERSKAKSRKKHHHHRRKISPPASSSTTETLDSSQPDEPAVDTQTDSVATSALHNIIGRARRNSIDSDSSEISFDRLQRVLDDGMAAMGISSVQHMSPHGGRSRRGSSGRRRTHSNSNRKGLVRSYSSDTDYVDGDAVVPSCEAVLDNSKSMSYTMGRPNTSGSSLLLPTPGEKEGKGQITSIAASSRPSTTSLGRKYSKEDAERRAGWLKFKADIIRLAHTLKLKGWRRVPLDSAEAADAISVERLSGAMTNAVYVVTPPPDLSRFPTPLDSVDNSTASLEYPQPCGSKSTPEKLLLRVYGPQVEHLIDRETELAVLRRLARKKIGPRLLGTFTNGRFEQYFNASPLTFTTLREPETSVLIAKRMRELHDGVEVLDSERFAGPGIWKNWDKWLHMAEARMSYIDQLVKEGKGKTGGWKGKGYVCGVEWPSLRKAVEKYKQMLEDYYTKKGIDVRDRLVFAHNDTQYGNILRINPADEKSPLLAPANEHKQLVVIDFEYAAANTPGLEFANHFSEWTYNYHDESRPHACNHKRYPTPEEQIRFIRAYVEHKSKFNVSAGNTPVLTPQSTPALPSEGGSSSVSITTTAGGSPSSDRRRSSAVGTPSFLPHTGSSSSIVEFMLDARVPPGGWKEEERKKEEEKERLVAELVEETRLWRLANSVQWVAWGVVQASIKGFGEEEGDEGKDVATTTTTHALDMTKMGLGREEVVETGKTRGQVVEVEVDGGDVDDVAEDEFDYLLYAHDRAMWAVGDCIAMGVLTLDDVPEEARKDIKIVEY